MNSGTKRGQFQRQSGGFLPCVSPSYLLLFIAAVFCLIGYHTWSTSSRMDRCRLEVKRYRAMLQEATQQKMMLDGRLSELHQLMDRRVKQLTKAQEFSQSKRTDEKEKRVLALETELVEVKEKLERCGNMAFRAQSRIEEAESNSKTSTVIRNKTQCDLEINRQYDEIDKWIKSMVDDRTYSQFQMKFGKDGEKSEADKLQRLEKIVMQRDEIKAAKDEKVKEEIRAREAKLEAQQQQQKGRKAEKEEPKNEGRRKEEEEEPRISEARAASVQRELAAKEPAAREVGDRSNHDVGRGREGGEKHMEDAKAVVDTRFQQEPDKKAREEMKEEPRNLKKDSPPKKTLSAKPLKKTEQTKANKRRATKLLDRRAGRIPARGPVEMMQKTA